VVKQLAARFLARVRGLSMAGRYLLLSFVFVIVGGGTVALSLGQLIEGSAIDRTTAVTALYVESFVAPTLQSLATSPTLSPAELDTLQALANNSPLTEKVVSFRIWSTDGHILYSPVPELIGRQFEMTGERGQAARGDVIGDISDLSDPENVFERQHWSRLIEIYLPVRVSGGSRVIAVAEFYQLPDDLEAEVNRDRLITWAMVAAATLLAYLALARVVRQGTETIARQQAELQEQVTELSALLGRNARLSARIRQAAARTTALTELERRRIGSDLHDGPTQTLAFAMLRLDALDLPVPAGDSAEATDPADSDLAAVRGALDDAMRDIRAIAAGLRTPELEESGPADIARRAVAEHERRSGSPAALTLGEVPAQAPLATKIALYRILSEALSNAARHGGGQGIAVRVAAAGPKGGELLVEVADQGSGFDTTRNPGQGHLGLAGMRERAELLGGRLELVSALGAGTTVRAYLPLAAQADDGSWAS
jgi:signal transduction histidine kinase